MTAFDRPEYLARTLEGYAQLTGLTEYPFYFFLDGPSDAASAERCQQVRKIADAFEHPDKHVHARPKNIGIAHQIYESKKHLFTTYDAVLSCVDDYAVAPYALQAVLTAHQAYEQARPGVKFTMDAFHVNIGSAEEKQPQLDVLRLGYEHAFYLMTREVWDLIEPDFAEYVRLFIQPYVDAGAPRPYRRRNSGRIRAWFREKLGVNVASSFASSQDGLVRVSMQRQEIRAVTTEVNHTACFGMYGEHQNPGVFRKRRFDQMHLDLFDADDVLAALAKPRII